jgi:hypothetical protein
MLLVHDATHQHNPKPIISPVRKMRPIHPASIVAAFIGSIRFVAAQPAAIASSVLDVSQAAVTVVQPEVGREQSKVPHWVPANLPIAPRDNRQIASAVIYEAEAAATYDPASVIDGANSGARGDRYIDMGGVGSWLQFVVDDEDDDEIEDPEASNDCRISFRYASASRDGHTRPCSVSVNGVIIDTVNFSTTFWWRRWDIKRVWAMADCSPGTTIRLTALSKHGGPNIDHMTLEYMYQLDPNQVEAAGKLRGSSK